MLKIYGRPDAINVRKVLWAAEELSIPYQNEAFGRGFKPTDSPEFKAISAWGVVPVIDDGGFVLRESNTILRYLAAREHRSDLLGAHLEERARIESWMDWAATDLNIPTRQVFLGICAKLPAYTDPASIANGIATWTNQMRLLDQHLAANGPYLTGERFTLADIPAGLGVNRWFGVPFEKPDLPAVSAYYDRLGERPAYRRHGRNGTP